MMYDFTIIGGGIAGISAAARLAPMGKTHVLEAENVLAYHASGRSAALFEPFYGAHSVNDLSLAGENYFRNAHGGVLSKRGIMIIARKGEEAQLKTEAASFRMNHITVNAAVALIPILDSSVLTQAAISNNAEDMDTDLLIQNFARDARANGTEIRTKTPVTAIKKTKNSWIISSGEYQVETKTVINTCYYGDFIRPCASGIDHYFRFNLVFTAAYYPAVFCFLNCSNRGFSLNFCAIRAGFTGEVLDQQICVDVFCIITDGGLCQDAGI